MRVFRGVLTGLIIQCCLATQVFAGEFAWLDELDSYAQTEPAAFRVSLTERFELGDADMQAVFNNVERPAEAYMILRLGEIAGRLSFHVIHLYHFNKSWTTLADKLDINPNSGEFQALLTGHDLQIVNGTQHNKAQDVARSDTKDYGKHASLN